MSILRRFVLAGLVLLSLAASPPKPSLVINPSAVFQHSGGKNGSVTYTIKGASSPVICTGWRYPIYNLPREEQPLRRSCRQKTLSHFTETWSNFNYVGEYYGFVELYDSFIQVEASRPTLKIETPFRVLESIY